MRPSIPEDLSRASRFALETSMFTEEESHGVEQQLLAVVRGEQPGTALTAEVEAALVGFGYVAPEPFSDRCWNLCFLVVDPARHGRGIGSAVVAEVERRLPALGPEGARVLLIETSSTATYDDTRAFYLARGYAREATVREYYGPGDHKVIFWKLLAR